MSYPPVSPTLAVNDADAALEFYKKAFGATEHYRLTDPETGKIGHAEFSIGGQLLMLGEEYPQYNKSPCTLGGTCVRFAVMVEDVDVAFERAVQAGAETIRPPADQFYGHRSGCLRDPFGHEWMLQSVIEEVSPDEMQKRWNAFASEEKTDTP